MARVLNHVVEFKRRLPSHGATWVSRPRLSRSDGSEPVGDAEVLVMPVHESCDVARIDNFGHGFGKSIPRLYDECRGRTDGYVCYNLCSVHGCLSRKFYEPSALVTHAAVRGRISDSKGHCSPGHRPAASSAWYGHEKLSLVPGDWYQFI